PACAAMRTAVCTCSVFSARTTASGSTACGSSARSQRYDSSVCGSVTTTPLGSAPTSSSIAAANILAPLGYGLDRYGCLDPGMVLVVDDLEVIEFVVEDTPALGNLHRWVWEGLA